MPFKDKKEYKKHSHNFIDLTNKKFSRLTVINFSHKDKNGKTFWLCKCSCGNKIIVYSQKLKTGHTKSCGCLWKEKISTHKESKTLLYVKWHSMLSRVGKINGYKDIKVCKRWLKYENFRKDMYNLYINHCKKYGTRNTTIDRINTFGNYKPSNCRFATVREQNNNKRKQNYFKHNGEIKTIGEWYLKYKPNISQDCFYNRLIRLNWKIDEALSTPIQYHKRKS